MNVKLMIISPRQIYLALLLVNLQYIQSQSDEDLSDIMPESQSLQNTRDNLNVAKKVERPTENESKFEHGDDKLETKSVSMPIKRENLSIKHIKNILSKFLSTLKRNKRKATNPQTHHKGQQRNPKWQKWTEWSTCSVTCGKGRAIRWRHCQENCDEIETEMEEISCQLPECPRKLFGLIKLN